MYIAASNLVSYLKMSYKIMYTCKAVGPVLISSLEGVYLPFKVSFKLPKYQLLTPEIKHTANFKKISL